jgi:hypothetical protein
VEVLPKIKAPRLTRAGASPVGVAEVLNGQQHEKTSKAKAAAILMLDILEEEGQQKQSELFEMVAKETGLKVGTVQRKAYWDILQEEGLVANRKDGFKGGWLVSRSERERPPNLQSVTVKHDPTMTGAGHASTSSHASGDLPSIANHDSNKILSHPSCITMRSMTPDPVSHPSPVMVSHSTPLSGVSGTGGPEDTGRV